jgi:site-specific recombinase XerD
MSVTLRSRKLKDGRRSLFLDVYDKGTRDFVFLELYLGKDAKANREIMSVANQIRLKTELEQAAGRLGVHLPRPARILLSDIADMVSQNKVGTNQKLFTLMMKHIEMFGGEGLTTQDINPLWCEGFKNHLIHRMKSSSASSLFSKLKSLLSFAIRQGMIDRNPCEGISIKSQESLPKFLTLDEVRQLVSTPCINQQIRNAFLFGVMTGLRWSDITNLQWVDIVDGSVLIRQQKVQRMVSIPLSRWALDLLAEQRNTPISSYQRPHKYTDQVVFKLPCINVVMRTLKRWAKDAKIPKSISPHWARHTFATLLINRGVDPVVICQLMGHSKMSMTLRYAKLLNPRKVEVMNLFPEIG